MPPILPSPKSPSAVMKPIGKSPISTSVQPNISQSPTGPNARHPRGSKVVEMVMGVRIGMGGAHNVAVLDMTFDSAQVFPYLVHCDTCAWESRQATLAYAKQAAHFHAGV